MTRLTICGIGLAMALLVGALAATPPEAAGVYPVTDAEQREFHRQLAEEPVGTVSRISPYATVTNLGGGEFRAEFSGLPATLADGRPIDARWIAAGEHFTAGLNLFAADVEGTHITVEALSDQPWGGRAGDQVVWQPQLFLDGVEQTCGAPTVLETDPTNENYHDNVLEWDYGICKRRLRIIEGSILGSWLFATEPGGAVRIQYNQSGALKLKLGRYAISDDEEAAAAEVFRRAEYPFEVRDDLTFYPNGDPETTSVDGHLFHYLHPDHPGMSFAELRLQPGTDSADSGEVGDLVRISADYDTPDMWRGIVRSIFLFDTSGLPEGAVVSSATLSLRGSNKHAVITGWLDPAVYSSAPYENDGLRTGDFDSLGTTAFSPGISIDNWDITGYNDFVLNASGIAVISTTGVTKYGTRTQHYDGDGTNPPWDGGGYKMVATYFAEKGTGYKPKLLVTYTPPCTPPAIISHPSSATKCEGQAVSFSVTASGTEPLSYQWRKDTSPLSDGGNISGATTATLTIGPVGTGDAGDYDCVVTNDCGSATSNAATLTVQESPTADAGADFTMCETGGQLNGSASNYDTVTWSGGAGTFSPDANTLDATYTPHADEITAGTVTLTLTATAISPCSADATDEVVITIQGSPTVDAGPPQTICETDTATMAGSATNAASTEWSTAGDGWFDDAASLTAVYTPGAGDITAGAVTLTLRANATSPCTGYVEDTMDVTVNPNTAIDTQPQPVTVIVNGQAQFSVTASGSGTLTYQWRKDGSPLSDGGNISGATTATLTIDPVEFADAGDYDCVVDSIDGCGPAVTSAAATLTVTLDSADVALTPDDTCYSTLIGPATVVVDIGFDDVANPVTGGQFFLAYDDTVLTFVSAEPGDSPFTREVHEAHPGDDGAGTIDYAVGIAAGQDPTTTPTVMARITFTTSAITVCSTADLVTFRAHDPPTRLSDDDDNDVTAVTANLSAITIDGEAPTITPAAGDSTVECDGAGNSTELDNWLSGKGGAAASDNCTVTVVWSNDFTALSDDCGATGSATVTFTATDDCGNTSTTVATFTIEDTTPPSITTVASDQTVECDGSGNTTQFNNWLDNHGGAAASDVCGGVAWSHDSTGLSDLCGATGAETVTFTATDDCGLTSTTQATFTIEDTTPPSISTQASAQTVECDGSGNTTEFTNWLSNHGGAVASDVCGGVSWSHDSTGLSDDCGATGSETVTFTATDNCGLTSTTTATFTIEDTTAPSITTPASDQTVECDGSGNTTEFTNWLDSHGGALASDVCGGVAWSHDSTGLSDLCGATGAETVIFTATDDCGLTSTTQATFTIEDTTAPTFSNVPADVTEDADAGLCTLVWPLAPPTANDVCGSATVTYERSDNATLTLDDPYPGGTTTITWTAEDECGLQATDTTDVTVNAYNTVVVDVTLSPTIVTGPITRCITFEFCSGGSVVQTETVDVAFTDGAATGLTFDVDCGSYDCLLARDELHTLARVDTATVDTGTSPYAYTAAFTDKSGGAGDDDRLVGGNLNDDSYIDILDFGIYVIRENVVSYDSDVDMVIDGDTPCGWTPTPMGPYHADIQGDGVVAVEDFSFIALNFLEWSDTCCGGLLGGGGPDDGPITSISVAELFALGLGELAIVDLNHDGWLDLTDLELYLQGVRPGEQPEIEAVEQLETMDPVPAVGQPRRP